MVGHYQKDSDGLVTRLKVPVKKKSGKVEYSVDSEDFKKSRSGGLGGGERRMYMFIYISRPGYIWGWAE